MPDSEPPSGHDRTGAEVLTLPEVAAFLRVPEEAVSALVATDALPGQKVGGEWRFLKRAVVDWLRFGPHVYPEFRMFPPPWLPSHPFWDDLVQALEKRILGRLPPPVERGSKQAVLKYFGVFRDDADVDEQLAGLRARREAAGE